MPKKEGLKKVVIIGSGPIVIGQAAEFDYAGTQACLALKEEGIEVVLINHNPATIMTDESIADKVYMEPITVENVSKILEKERPDGLIGTLGGQTGLNVSVELYKQGILDKYGVKLLGTSVTSIEKGEDREQFRRLMLEIGEPIPESAIIENYEDGLAFVKEIGYPVIIRPAYTLGGSGGGFAYNEEELSSVLKQGLKQSPIHQVLVEKSIKGWKEIEYEVMRDENDTCIIVCNMENIDPVGVHTGDSMVVAPSQTLTDVQYQLLRNASLKVIRALGIVGGCNIQFALHPESNEYRIIEVNPRVSRSSALASKATGYPIARMAAKCAIGYHLDEMLNPITGNTYASFEPALDYIVVKLPRFPFDKFSEGDRTLGTQMKATGEVMAVDRTFEGALNKALRSLEINSCGLTYLPMKSLKDEELIHLLKTPTDLRLFAIAEAMQRGYSIESIHSYTEIDYWFLTKIQSMVELEQKLVFYHWESVPSEILIQAKKYNISDERIAQIFSVEEKIVRQKWKELKIQRGYKAVDTCAAEFDAITPYYYSTWNGMDEVDVPHNTKKILVIGSGPIRIGQGIEFDYCSVHAALAVKKKGYEAIVINNNPETVSTDYSIADRLYFEPLAVEDVLAVAEKEKVEGVLIQFGGQTAINLAKALEDEGVQILGTSTDAIDQLEDRNEFYHLLNELSIPHIEGLSVHSMEDLKKAVKQLDYPILIRPSFVIGGQAMFICSTEEELHQYMEHIQSLKSSKIWPLMVDRYLPGLECEMDIVSDGKDIVIPGIFEHVERAGVHSGDSIAIFPPISITDSLKEVMVQYAKKIATKLPIIGLMNIQFVIHNGTVYVLEVNPRASRTVPIISKVTGAAMIEWATHVQLGESLKALGTKLGLLEEPTFYSLKLPVFSSNKLKGVDHVLGPEMKSTGEWLSLGTNVKEVFHKGIYGSQERLFETRDIFCSIADRAKVESLTVLKNFIEKGFNLYATIGTAQFLKEHGIPVTVVEKDFEKLKHVWREKSFSLVINIPTKGRDRQTFGFYLRELAIQHQVPYFTSIDTIQKILQYGMDENILLPTKTLLEYKRSGTITEVNVCH